MQYKDELAVLRPQWLSRTELKDRIGAFFTERTGGVSSGPWGGAQGIMGLNVGVRVGDNAGCVRMNRAIVAQIAGAQPRWMTQVHGTRVVRAEEVDGDALEADAQIALTPGVVCAVQVADCLPVLIAETRGRAVAAVHAGWRSLAGGIIENTVNQLRLALGPEGASAGFAAWLGPRIGFDDFETSADVKDAFTARWPACTAAVKPAAVPGKWLVDLAGFAREALRSCGIEDVEDCGLSTVADGARFYSYRRDGQQTGRHAALIWIKPGAGPA